jgi:hypothetical protein
VLRFFSRTVARFVHLKIDTRSRSEILASGMNRRRTAEAAEILAEYFRRDRARGLVQHVNDLFQIVLRIEPNEMFWHRCRLDKEKPPHVSRRELFVGLLIHCQSWSDVHETNLFDAVGIVETQPMGSPSAPIVGAHQELLVPISGELSVGDTPYNQ